MGVLWFVGRGSARFQLVNEGGSKPAHRPPVVRAARASMIESLEQRVFLSASGASPHLVPAVTPAATTLSPYIASSVTAISSNPAGNITTPGQNTKTFDILYFSPDGIDTTTVGLNNLTVSGPNGALTGTLNVVEFTIVSNTGAGDNVLVQYTFQKTGDSNFTPLDNGTYFVSTTATVQDLNVPPDTEIARSPIDFFVVNIPDTTPPVATQFKPSNNGQLLLAGGDQYQFNITYADLYSQIDVSTVNTNNVTVTGPNGQNIPVISATVNPPDVNGTPVTVTYTVQNPTGLWSAAANGTYFVSINNTLMDTAGLSIVPVIGVGTFTVDLPDVTSPTTTAFNPPSPVSGGTFATFSVVYTDEVAVNVSTLNSSNVIIIGPHGQAEYATFVAADPNTNSTDVTATYEFTAPNTTTFTSADNGVYTFDLLSTVQDTAGHSIPAATLGTLNLALNPADIARTEIGQFGNVNGKNVSLHFRDIPQGTVGTLRLSGGVGQAFLETSNSLVDLYIADAGSGVKLTITTNNSQPLQLGNILINGTLLSGALATSQLHGTFFATGAIQQLTIANIFGSLVAAGPIGTVNVVHSITGGEILSGVNLGSDGQFGGTGAAADTYGAGSIGAVKVGTSIASTFIGAGIKPDAEGQFGTSDDTVIGGTSSLIGYLQAKIIDTTSKFEAGAFGKAKFGNKFVNVGTDPLFIVPPAAT
jgi:hypothetical protein